ncbi:MAG: nucleotidyltransferase family protein [Proteobacteria bacterium]|nr:nucleotidyltransferase family protein [Pseudomonadota bacterium]
MKKSFISSEDVLNKLRENGSQLQAMGVKRLGLFGSFVRGEQKNASDIDFIVEFETDKKTFDNFMTFSFFLEVLFQRRVELVTAESLSPYIGPYILKEAEYVSLAA